MAYRLAEAFGIQLWCQDEAGPYQTIPYPGSSWQLQGAPAKQPHEYIKAGTAKLLTLFRPATGEERAKGVSNSPNTVLHSWLKQELEGVLDTLDLEEEGQLKQLEGQSLSSANLQGEWEYWCGVALTRPLVPLRMILVWDNLAGHTSYEMVKWLYDHGILPLYTPLGGSWLNMAESVQRIIVRRALDGQHAEKVEELINWLEQTVEGWNKDPPPFEWGGKRQERRKRARARRLGGSGAVVDIGKLNVA